MGIHWQAELDGEPALSMGQALHVLLDRVEATGLETIRKGRILDGGRAGKGGQELVRQGLARTLSGRKRHARQARRAKDE
jgi:hypothetical protein